LTDSAARLRDFFQQHPSTQHIRAFTDEDLIWLTRRLESNAESELYQFLSRACQLGYHNMPIYPLKPPGASRPGVQPPLVPEPAGSMAESGAAGGVVIGRSTLGLSHGISQANDLK
jgi:hypothetical protein